MARHNKMKTILTVGLGFLFATVGCQSASVMIGRHPGYHGGAHVKEGPPPWAPAHGYRAKHRYLYYPSSYVYFDTERKLYFYYNAGGWQVSVGLPTGICINADDYVTLEMDTGEPYKFHQDVVKRYPPGHQKHTREGKGKKGWKGRGAS